MELRQYIAILRRRKGIIFGTMLLAILLAVLFSYFASPIYRSSTTMRVATIGGGLTGRYTDIVYTQRLMNTYSLIVTGGNMKQSIVENLNLPEDPVIDVEVIPNTELLKISVEASTPQTAQDIANETADLLIQESRELYTGGGQSTVDILSRQIEQAEADLVNLRSEYEKLLVDGSADSPDAIAVHQSIEFRERTYSSLLEQYDNVRLNEAFLDNAVTVVEPSSLPTSSARPRTTLIILLGAVHGLMTGVTLALVRENLDTKLYSTGQIEKVTGSKTIGRIPTAQKTLGAIGSDDVIAFQPQVEAFRRLRINLLAFVPDGQPYTILVTSASEGEGKSTVASNLALSIAKSGRSVVIVDCDLYRPALHSLYGLNNDKGLTNFLLNQVGVSGILQATELSNLKVVTNGPEILAPAGPNDATHLAPTTLTERLQHGSELLGSVHMHDLLDELRGIFDVVLLDTPALTTVTDAAVLVPDVDHVLLVVAQSQARFDAVSSARDQLGVMSVQSMGVVINRA